MDERKKERKKEGGRELFQAPAAVLNDRLERQGSFQ